MTQRAPHFNSVTNYMSSPKLTPILHDLITISSLPCKALESDFAVDSFGFSTSRREVVRSEARALGEGQRREWVKAHLMVGVRPNVVTFVEISGWRDNDSRYFDGLVRYTPENFQISDLTADKAYLSRRNLAVAEDVGAVPIIPFKANTAPMLPKTLRGLSCITCPSTSARSSCGGITAAPTWRRRSR